LARSRVSGSKRVPRPPARITDKTSFMSTRTGTAICSEYVYCSVVEVWAKCLTRVAQASRRRLLRKHKQASLPIHRSIHYVYIAHLNNFSHRIGGQSPSFFVSEVGFNERNTFAQKSNRSRPGWGLVHFSARKAVWRTCLGPKTWTCPLPRRRGGQSHFHGEIADCVDDVPRAAKIGQSPVNAFAQKHLRAKPVTATTADAKAPTSTAPKPVAVIETPLLVVVDQLGDGLGAKIAPANCFGRQKARLLHNLSALCGTNGPRGRRTHFDRR